MATAGGQAQSRKRLVIPAVLAAVALGLFALGCGGNEKTLDSLLSRVNQGRDAQALSSLQQALIAATLVRTESGGSYGASPVDLAQKLQAQDPSKRFGIGPSTGPEQVQVLGGGTTPAMLVVQSNSKNFVAVWSDGNATAYYRGVQPPAFVAQHPAGGGWSDQADVSRLGT